MHYLLKFRQLTNILWLRILLILISQFGTIANATVCSYSYQDSKTISIQVNKKNIRIFGWMHNSEDNSIQNIKKFMNILNAFKTNVSCLELNNIAADLLLKQKEFVDSSMDLYHRLQTIPQSHQSTLAIETSEAERHEVNNNIDSLYSEKHSANILRFMEDVEKKCPQYTDNLNQFELMIMTPERLYYQNQINSHHAIAIKGVDDLALRKESIAAISAETRNFNIENEQKNYPISTYLAIKKIISDFVVLSEIPKDLVIQSALESIVDIKSRERAQLFLKELRNVAKIAAERNIKIAENIMKLNGDVNLVIGSAHIDGIKKQLMKQCDQVIELSNESRAVTPEKILGYQH